MTTLRFSRASNTLTATLADGAEFTYPAANNVQHGCEPWPDGEFAYVAHVTHEGDGPASAYGSFGGLLFDVPGQTGMEIHSGRLMVPDGLMRSGIYHCTLGCIRTMDGAVRDLLGVLVPGDLLVAG